MTGNDKCADCGQPRKEHSYNGACYGVCGEYRALEASQAVEAIATAKKMLVQAVYQISQTNSAVAGFRPAVIADLNAIIAALTTPTRIEAAQQEAVAKRYVNYEGHPELGSPNRNHPLQAKRTGPDDPPIQAAESGLLDEALEVLSSARSILNALWGKPDLPPQGSVALNRTLTKINTLLAKAGKPGEAGNG